MYISITRQHMDTTFSQSASDFVDYLEKENEGKRPELQEHFFDQYNLGTPSNLVLPFRLGIYTSLIACGRYFFK